MITLKKYSSGIHRAKSTVIPSFKPAEFAVSWRLWWQNLQPDWQANGTWPLSHETPDDEDWGDLCKGGINGLFLIMMCLSWWGPIAVSKKDHADFYAAKEDVFWVFEQVARYLQKLAQGEKRATDASTDGRATKHS